MAIVFISPKQSRKTLIYIIIGAFALGLIIFGIFIFVVRPSLVPVEQVFTVPKIEIDFELLASEKVRELQLFEGVKYEFTYRARTKEGEAEAGRITAVSKEAAISALEELGLLQIEVEEIPLGRDNFFIFPQPSFPEEVK